MQEDAIGIEEAYRAWSPGPRGGKRGLDDLKKAFLKHMSYSLNSFKGGDKGGFYREYFRGYKAGYLEFRLWLIWTILQGFGAFLNSMGPFRIDRFRAEGAGLKSLSL